MRCDRCFHLICLEGYFGRNLSRIEKQSSYHGFTLIVTKSKRKPNNVLIKKKVLQQPYVKKWLDDNDILMYSTYNEGKSMVTERFWRLKSILNSHLMTVNLFLVIWIN